MARCFRIVIADRANHRHVIGVRRFFRAVRLIHFTITVVVEFVANLKLWALVALACAPVAARVARLCAKAALANIRLATLDGIAGQTIAIVIGRAIAIVV